MRSIHRSCGAPQLFADADLSNSAGIHLDLEKEHSRRKYEPLAFAVLPRTERSGTLIIFTKMMTEIGEIEAIFRYPVKSMAGERLEVSELGWHGLEGDRRLALRRISDRGGFPWLSAGKLPDLVRFVPIHNHGTDGQLPTRIRIPQGKEMEVFGEELAAEVERLYGEPVQMMHLKRGIFDEASVSVIASETIREIARLSGVEADVRRFRPNVVVRLREPRAFGEDEWLGGGISFGDGVNAPKIMVTTRDVRCSMVNLDPDSAVPSPEVLKTIVRVNENNAGVYGTITRTGQVSVGQKVFLAR